VPQLSSSVSRSTHAPLQLTCGNVQLTVHVPPEQTSPGWHMPTFMHVVPHVAALLRFVQTPPQLTVPIGQQMPPALYSVTESQHRPAVHVSVAAHGALHAPQFDSSVCVFVQLVPLQLSRPVPQQMPPSHVVPVPHAALHAPQLELFVSGSTHVPLQLSQPMLQHLPPTFSWPVPQHRPSSHVWPVPQIAPPLPAQPPQFISSVFVFEQAPLQSSWPIGQSSWH
jgi:hypothetical protein